MNVATSAVLAHSWLLLIHQIPAKPAYLRVKVWRRLQGIGAIAVKNAVHVLPMNEETQEDFEWLLREIEQGGGEAFVCEARLIDGLSDQEIRTLFDQARDADYAQLLKDARALAKSLRPNAKGSALAEVRAQIARLRKRLAEIVAIDFFGAIGRETVEETIRTLEARFKFVSGKGYRAKQDELRFDMFEAEFTHEGDKCTFEVLLDRCGLKDAALRAIAEIIHDIDLKDGKFGRTEVAGIRTLIEGIGATTSDDTQRIARGTEVFNDLYEYFRKRRR